MAFRIGADQPQADIVLENVRRGIGSRMQLAPQRDADRSAVRCRCFILN